MTKETNQLPSLSPRRPAFVSQGLSQQIGQSQEVGPTDESSTVSGGRSIEQGRMAPIPFIDLSRRPAHVSPSPIGNPAITEIGQAQVTGNSAEVSQPEGGAQQVRTVNVQKSPSPDRFFLRYKKAEQGVEIDPLEMGINQRIFQKLVKAANKKNCVIMIRKTNKGSVIYFDTGTGTGKKLPTKGKSSESYFTNGSIPFFADMAKKVGNWYYEQTNLIDITSIQITAKDDRGASPKYSYIPKLVALDDPLLDTKDGSAITVSNSSGKIVTVRRDKLGGTIKEVTYYLKKVIFRDVNSVNGQKIKAPHFLKGNTPESENNELNSEDIFDACECYQVFILKSDLDAISVGVIMEGHYVRELGTDTIPVGEVTEEQSTESPPSQDIFNRANFWDKLWKNRKVDEGSLGSKILNASPLKDFADIEIFDGKEYYAVKVLALLTQGTVEKKTSKKPKMYFEVVADYDNFMIAPSIDLLFDTSTVGNSENIDVAENNLQEQVSGGDRQSHGMSEGIVANFKARLKQAKALPQLENKYWSNWNIESNYIPKSDSGAAHYGIYSEYEKDVRKEMNKQMGIKAVQHGCEVANLFFTSDIFEPLILILPSKNTNIGKQLFFVDLKILFSLLRISNTNYDYKSSVKISKDQTWDISYALPGGFSIANEFAFIFNLNWGGTDYYFQKTLPGGTGFDEAKIAKQREFKELIEWLEDYVFSFGGTHSIEKSEFVKVFNGVYKEDTFPIKALKLFLYQNYKLIADYKKLYHSGALSVFAKITKVDYRMFHYKFIKKLMYMSEYYIAVHHSADEFAELVHIGVDEVAEVKKQYVEAVRAIVETGEKYVSTIWEGRDIGRRADPAAAYNPVGEVDGRFARSIEEWLEASRKFLPETIK
jgi:hypothetical protein